MTETKKGLIKAGTIIAIFLAVFGLLGGFGLFAISNEALNDNAIIESIKEEDGYTYVEDGDDYYIEYEDDGVVVRLTKDDLLVNIKIVKYMFNVVLFIVMGISIVSIIISKMLQSDLINNRRATGKIIALLVVSLLMGNTITAILMIIALCIKDTQITYENINDYYVEDKF